MIFVAQTIIKDYKERKLLNYGNWTELKMKDSFIIKQRKFMPKMSLIDTCTYGNSQRILSSSGHQLQWPSIGGGNLNIFILRTV